MSKSCIFSSYRCKWFNLWSVSFQMYYEWEWFSLKVLIQKVSLILFYLKLVFLYWPMYFLF